MKRKTFQLVLITLLVFSLVTTVAYAYVGQTLGSRVLSYGMVGGDVRELQDSLNSRGYYVGYADGVFGIKTKNGVASFQKDRGLIVDGIVGPQTLASLNSSNSSGNGKSLARILKEKNIANPIPNLNILVDKSDHLLTLYSGSTPLKSYHVALGDGGSGDKQRAGDHKTPEGKFYIAERSVLSPSDRYLGSRWMRISYPNIEDAQRGLNAGMIDQATYQKIVNAISNREIPPQNTPLGGGIGIHGGTGTYDNDGDNWTWGCIGLTNPDVQEIYDYIKTGTSLVIKF